jgi:hypothetical protein
MIKISDIPDILPNLILADSNITFPEFSCTAVVKPSKTDSYIEDTVTKEGLKLTAEEQG